MDLLIIMGNWNNMMGSNVLFSKYIIEKKVDMITIIMEYYHQIDRCMVLVDISKYGLMKMDMILDSITKGNLKKIKNVDKDI